MVTLDVRQVLQAGHGGLLEEVAGGPSGQAEKAGEAQENIQEKIAEKAEDDSADDDEDDSEILDDDNSDEDDDDGGYDEEVKNAYGAGVVADAYGGGYTTKGSYGNKVLYGSGVDGGDDEKVAGGTKVQYEVDQDEDLKEKVRPAPSRATTMTAV